MDNRDEIIRTQLDVIGSLINSSMRRMSDDFWGNPATKTAQDRKTNEPPAVAEKHSDETPVAEVSEQPPENIEDLKAELNELIGL